MRGEAGWSELIFRRGLTQSRAVNRVPDNLLGQNRGPRARPPSQSNSGALLRASSPVSMSAFEGKADILDEPCNVRL